MSDATGPNQDSSAVKTLEPDQLPVPPQAPEVDIDALAASTRVSIEDYLALRKSVFSDEKQENRLRRALTKLETEKGFESDADLRVKYGVFLWILRKPQAAEEQFLQCRTNIAGAYFLGRCLLETNRCSEAKGILQKVLKRKPNSLACALTVVTALQKTGEMDSALKMLKELKKAHKKNDEILYHLGFVLDYQGFHEKADEFYDKALELNPFNEGALFRKAYRADLYDNEEEAFTLYRRCLEVNPPNANAVINLGILHEDKGEFQQAIECYENVLKTYPTHPRALTFLQDALASIDMHVDEEREKKDDRLAQILRIPVTDFELSVRSRNCLKKMEILTLGDLIIKTEAELLSYKNFGETSLAEIKAILDSKGLNLGMDHDSIDTPPPRIDIADLFNAGGADTRSRPIGDLGLSIRARKCMDTLNVRSVGDLIDKTESELLKCSNFGLTSLHDVKQKLAQFGVDLVRE